VGSWVTLRVSTLRMYSECVDEAPVADSDSFLNRDTEPIIRFRLAFVSKLGLVLPFFLMGMGTCSHFLFSVFEYET